MKSLAFVSWKFEIRLVQHLPMDHLLQLCYLMYSNRIHLPEASELFTNSLDNMMTNNTCYEKSFIFQLIITLLQTSKKVKVKHHKRDVLFKLIHTGDTCWR